MLSWSRRLLRRLFRRRIVPRVACVSCQQVLPLLKCGLCAFCIQPPEPEQPDRSHLVALREPMESRP